RSYLRHRLFDPRCQKRTTGTEIGTEHVARSRATPFQTSANEFINMNAFIITATVSFFASLVLHELGHYIAARMCAVPVRQAGLGWGPKLIGVRLQQVDYQMHLLPVGAYVQMDMKALQSR